MIVPRRDTNLYSPDGKPLLSAKFCEECGEQLHLVGQDKETRQPIMLCPRCFKNAPMNAERSARDEGPIEINSPRVAPCQMWPMKIGEFDNNQLGVPVDLLELAADKIAQHGWNQSEVGAQIRPIGDTGRAEFWIGVVKDA